MTDKILTGLEALLLNFPASLKNKRLGLLANPASVNTRFEHAYHLIQKQTRGQIKALFSPQHGFYAEKQDNMVESDHFIEPEYQIPVFSLYSKTRIPTPEMFEKIDTLIVDIQDVGTRVYTFIYTVSYCLEIAARLNKQVIILDRPNPIGGLQIEGNILETDYRSFVGRYPIPMRHGMTIGEIAGFFNKEFNFNAELSVICMKNWHRSMYWHQTGLPWIMPSPNLPNPTSAMVYPGQVIFEGTNISEGRGTTLPFEIFGAPFIEPEKIMKKAHALIDGAVLRPVNFQPTSGKWADQVCRGFQIHVTEPHQYRPYFTSLLLLQLIIKYHEKRFQFKQPPYEYEYEKLPIDLILGSRRLREDVVSFKDLSSLEKGWQEALKEFKSVSKGYYLYA